MRAQSKQKFMLIIFAPPCRWDGFCAAAPTNRTIYIFACTNSYRRETTSARPTIYWLRLAAKTMRSRALRCLRWPEDRTTHSRESERTWHGWAEPPTLWPSAIQHHHRRRHHQTSQRCGEEETRWAPRSDHFLSQLRLLFVAAYIINICIYKYIVYILLIVSYRALYLNNIWNN